MKKIMVRFVAMLVACGLVGCFQADQVVTLLPNGSGTIEETFMISRKIAESMAAFTGGMSDQPGFADNNTAKTNGQSFFKDDEIKKRAEGYGQGVKLVNMERIANKQFEGYKAVYSFRDINKLRLDQENPGMPKQSGKENDTKPKATGFVFTPGKTATLLVKQQKKNVSAGEAAAESAVPAKESSAEELAMVRQMFDGLRISTKLVIKGRIVDSNATHRTDSTITLVELDFGKLLDKPELLAKMAAAQPGDQAAAMEMIKNFPGMKVDMNDELRVSFR